ncbi:MAG: CRTAC1 family protein, partial [Fulvivirga sp.]
VGNDFHEDDYFYINKGDGTFEEKGKSAFTYMSRFSMGNDVADINHDGYPDLISLDMLPEDEVVLKRSEADENITFSKMRTDQYGYYYQYERIVMQVNQGNGKFLETGLLSNVAATDWSWSALFSDFDQDGNQDLFISNGIPRRPNDLDYIKYVSSEQIVNTIGATKLVDQKAMALMPSGKVKNYIFKGSGGFEFEDMSSTWLPDETTCSTATAFGDLDNDGDLDIVINNVDDAPGIYINQTNTSANYLKVNLNYNASNRYGIGSRVLCYTNGLLQYKELYTVRGFQSSSEPMVHFGLGASAVVDSLIIVWPNRVKQVIENVPVNQTLPVTYDNENIPFVANSKLNLGGLFVQVAPESIGITYAHKEDNYSDFDRLKLLPYQQSDKGPATAIGDLNNDGLEDIYFGGSKWVPGQVYQNQRLLLQHPHL